MNGLLGTILAGAVVVVIGAFAAYYFGVRQERLKQGFQREQEEQRRQEEKQREERRRLDERERQVAAREQEEQARRQEREQKLTEHRVEALGEIQSRATAVAEDLKSLAERVAVLRGKIPERKIGEATQGFMWSEFFSEYEKLAPQRDSVASDMASLRTYYQKQAPYLETTTRHLFESFDQELKGRYTLLSRHLLTDKSREYYRQLQQEEYDNPIVAVADALWSVTPGGLLRSKEYRQHLKSEFSNMGEGIEAIRNWNFKAHEAAFDEEAKRLASGL